MEKENVHNLAEKIALLLQNEANGSGDDFLRASLEKINQRLEKLESQIAFPNSNPLPADSTQQTFHSSQQQFKNLEELADEIINNLQNEKACPYEPTGKPCDQCAMCSSRGF